MFGWQSNLRRGSCFQKTDTLSHGRRDVQLPLSLDSCKQGKGTICSKAGKQTSRDVVFFIPFASPVSSPTKKLELCLCKLVTLSRELNKQHESSHSLN